MVPGATSPAEGPKFRSIPPPCTFLFPKQAPSSLLRLGIRLFPPPVPPSLHSPTKTYLYPPLGLGVLPAPVLRPAQDACHSLPVDTPTRSVDGQVMGHPTPFQSRVSQEFDWALLFDPQPQVQAGACWKEPVVAAPDVMQLHLGPFTPSDKLSYHLPAWDFRDHHTLHRFRAPGPASQCSHSPLMHHHFPIRGDCYRLL